MSYQKCPVCEGKGEVINTGQTSMYKQCVTCGGAGIIDSDTGLPPHSVEQSDKAVDDCINKVLEEDIYK